jgi:hypothetical protein
MTNAIVHQPKSEISLPAVADEIRKIYGEIRTLLGNSTSWPILSAINAHFKEKITGLLVLHSLRTVARQRHQYRHLLRSRQCKTQTHKITLIDTMIFKPSSKRGNYPGTAGATDGRTNSGPGIAPDGATAGSGNAGTAMLAKSNDFTASSPAPSAAGIHVSQLLANSPKSQGQQLDADRRSGKAPVNWPSATYPAKK